MVSMVALMLAADKFVMMLYNVLMAKKKPDSDPKNTFEKRNICAKTAQAYMVEGIVFLVLALIAGFRHV
jgi:hypothetical protein